MVDDAAVQLRTGSNSSRPQRAAGRDASEAAIPVSGTRCFDLARFDLSDMIECGRALREASEPSRTMEEAADSIVRLLHRSLVDEDSGEPNCALVRCFKTTRLGQLPGDLREIALETLGFPKVSRSMMPCLTLLGTAGNEPDWNDRRHSRGHAAIPLQSVEFVERAPMIAALLVQMGLDIESALFPDQDIILDAEQHAFNVFHVEYAEGSPTIPAQDFVRRHGVRSVLGFGGLLPSGDLFAVIMFARVQIPRETADLFRTIALGVKLALLPFTRGPVWNSELTEETAGTRATGYEDEQLRTEIATLRLLIPALEEAALQQTERLKTAVSDLRLQSEHIRQQGLRLSALLEATTDGVFLLDRDWRFTFLNSHAQNLLAPDGRELLGKDVWDSFPDAEQREFGRQHRRVMSEGVSVQFQEYYPAPLEKFFEVHAFPSEEGMASFFRDITERLKDEAKLRQTEKLAATGRMAASIAHEINNPLESVTNLLYLLQGDATMSAESKAWVETAESELRRVSEITTHMLRFHRQSTRAEEVDLAEILESVLVLFHGRIGQAEVSVERKFRPAKKLRGFGGELRQVFANFVGNALDASVPGDRLLLRVREACDASGDAGIRVTIADTGCGMNAEAKAKLFEPFYTTKGITGTGLGLWVSRQLIEKHGGRIKLRSVAERGTVFSVFLPFSMGDKENLNKSTF